MYKEEIILIILINFLGLLVTLGYFYRAYRERRRQEVLQELREYKRKLKSIQNLDQTIAMWNEIFSNKEKKK